MARTTIDIEEQACAEIMRRIQIDTKRKAVNVALRTIASEPMSSYKAKAMQALSRVGVLGNKKVKIQLHRDAKMEVAPCP